MSSIKKLACCVSILFTFLCNAQTLTGKVVDILDGDTFKLLLTDSTIVKVRLANIDCPEKKQPFSAKSKEFTSKAIYGKTVTINILKKDRYNRHISNVIYDDNFNLCHELVKAGLAWHFVKYSKDETLQTLEDGSSKQKLGLWQDPNPIAPWNWRATSKKKTPN